MKHALKVLSLSLCLALAGATAFAGGAQCAAKADKASCAMKSGEALGGSAEKASADKTGCAAAASACAAKSGESLGGSAEKAAADKAGCTAAASACAAKSGEALGGSGADKIAGAVKSDSKDAAACANMTAEQKAACAAACAAKSGESLGGSADKSAADKAACAAACAAKSGEALGGSGDDKPEKSAAEAGKLKACCPGCEGKIAKGEKPECCVAAAAKGGGAETKDAAAMKSDAGHEGHAHDENSKEAKKAAKAEKMNAESKGGSAEAGAGAYKVGSKIADEILIDVKTGAETTLSSKAGSKATVLVFWNQECPFVVDVQNRVNDFQKAYADKGVNVVALDAGVNNSLDSIKSYSEKYSFSILANPDSKVAAKFGATRTPEVFLLDSDMNVLYHGAFDSGTVQGGEKPESSFVATFVDNMLAGKANDVTQTKPFGCSLKYAKGVSAMK